MNSHREIKKKSLKKQVFTIYSSELWQINMIKRKKTGIFLYILLYVWLHYKSENILKLYLHQLQTQVCFGSKPERSMNDSLVSALGEFLDLPAVWMTSLFFKAVVIF